MNNSNESFAGLGLGDNVLRALDDMGFETPTPIQARTIPDIMDGNDMLGQAQTGTGKTAAFGIPLIEKLNIENRSVQAVIMCPTRELAIQVTGELIKIGKHKNGLNVVPVYGGQSISHQLKALKRGAHVVVGTPGRTIDHLKRGTLDLSSLSMVVFDEADEMLNMGFRDDMEKVLSYASQPVQTIMFSATVPAAIRNIMKRYMNKPKTVQIERESIAAPNINQYAMEVRDSVRTEAICRMMDVEEYGLALVFCNTKRKTESLARELKSRGYSSDVINGDLSQNQRDRVMNSFRKGNIDILVATDVAARGIDVDDIEVIFNYDIPQDPEYYVHRIGRTGRAGREGTAITFVSGRGKKQLRYIEKLIKVRLEPLNMPSAEDVEQSKMKGFFEDITEILEKGGLRPYIDQIEAMADDRFTMTEIAAALLRNQVGAEQSESTDSRQSAEEGGVTRLVFDLGYNQKIGPGNIVGAITGETGISGNLIGNIDIKQQHTFVDISSKEANKVVSIMNRNTIKGRSVKVKVA